MRNQLISMEITSVGLTMFLIWVATLPLLTVLVSLLVLQSLSWINVIGSLYATLLPTNTLLLWSIVLLPIHHRHRTWSYNEISRRYTDKELRFYCPREFRTQHKSNRQASNVEELIDPFLWHDGESQIIPAFHPQASEVYREHCQSSLNLFHELVNKGVCREQARGVLPQTLYTEYYGTCNLNNLLKFVSLRLHDGAQYEIQKVAEACLEIATDLFPVTVKAYRNATGHSEV